jgi:hypothetical protein
MKCCIKGILLKQNVYFLSYCFINNFHGYKEENLYSATVISLMQCKTVAMKEDFFSCNWQSLTDVGYDGFTELYGFTGS